MHYVQDIVATKYVLTQFLPVNESLLSQGRAIVESEDLWSTIEPLKSFTTEVEFSEVLGLTERDSFVR